MLFVIGFLVGALVGVIALTVMCCILNSNNKDELPSLDLSKICEQAKK